MGGSTFNREDTFGNIEQMLIIHFQTKEWGISLYFYFSTLEMCSLSRYMNGTCFTCTNMSFIKIQYDLTPLWATEQLPFSDFSFYNTPPHYYMQYAYWRWNQIIIRKRYMLELRDDNFIQTKRTSDKNIIKWLPAILQYLNIFRWKSYS